MEVEEAIAGCAAVAETVVYGVPVPGADGRAGMAAIVVHEGFNPADLATHLAARLPEYARPLFVRLCSQIATTGTFKPQKQALVRAGFDPGATDDPLFVSDRLQAGFVTLDAERFERIQNGTMRF